MSDLGANVPTRVPSVVPRYRRILVPMLVGASDLFALREGLLAHALRLRGADVLFVLCDGLTACDARTFDHDDPGMCASCLPHGEANLEALGLSAVRASQFTDPRRMEQLASVVYACRDADILLSGEGGDLGRHVFSSTLRYLRAGQWDSDDATTIAKGREYLLTAMRMREYARATIAHYGPDKILLSHGVYATWGPWADAAQALGVSFDTCCGGWRRNTLFLQHDDRRPLHCNDVWPALKESPLLPEERDLIEGYLETREDNRADAFQYVDDVDRSIDAFLARHAISLPHYERVVGVFSNVAFDSATAQSHAAFPDMFAWLRYCVARAAAYPETLFIVKAHPAEVNFVESTPEAWRVATVLRAMAPLPANVRIVGPDDRVSPFALYTLLDAGLVHTSSVGLEMALQGLPVLTTGAGVHYEQEGIVAVPGTRADYDRLFDEVVSGRHRFAPDREVALRYAFTLYFRKSLPFEPLDVRGWSADAITISTLRDLEPGLHPGLDRICAGILTGTPFVARKDDDALGSGSTA